jgi:hypothetical protein
MALEPHQQRVVEEAEELEGRIGRLRAFLEDPEKVASVAMEERGRMRRQLRAMTELLAILRERIEHF